MTVGKEETIHEKVEISSSDFDGIYCSYVMGCENREEIPMETTGEAVTEVDTESLEIKTEDLQPDKESSFSFADLRGTQFIFASGAGGWSTNMTIEGDGSFRGVYQDSNMGETGDTYPNGTVYQCSFQGRFSELEQVNKYTYKMQIAEMTYKNPVDREEVVDGVRYCYSAAYGLDGAEDMLIYLPGAPLAELPEGFCNWVGFSLIDSSETELPFYGLYNETQDCGFSSYNSIENIKQVIEDIKNSTDALETYINTEAATQTDMNISAAELYHQWDAALNQLWSVLKEILDTETMDALTVEEREWIEKKEQAVEEAGAEFGGGTIQSMVMGLKGAELTKARVYELLQWLE